MKYLKLPFKLLSIIITAMISWLMMSGLFFMITAIETLKNLINEVINIIEKE